jgi:hypothetical protein
MDNWRSEQACFKTDNRILQSLKAIRKADTIPRAEEFNMKRLCLFLIEKRMKALEANSDSFHNGILLNQWARWDFVASYERDCETESKRLIEKGFIKDGTGLLLILQAPSPSTLCSVRIDIWALDMIC